jgi:GntR family transcriptional regulator, transcriptional repressor for pyruvate dehydrogenase complex
MEHVTDKDEFLALDTQFHVAVASASGNALVPLLMEALREAVAREMRNGFDRFVDWPATRKRIAHEHEQIASKVASGDEDAAVKAITDHIQGFYKRLSEAPES